MTDPRAQPSCPVQFEPGPHTAGPEVARTSDRRTGLETRWWAVGELAMAWKMMPIHRARQSGSDVSLKFRSRVSACSDVV